jgi:hypothetical protein
MSKQQISITAFLACIDELRTKSVPLMAVYASTDKSVSRLFGFADGATTEPALIFSSTRAASHASSNIKVPVVDGSMFFREVSADLADYERERMERSYGDTVVSMIMPSGGRWMVFFTATL